MILVTGGTGLVGSHLIYKLVESGKKVKAIYRTKEKIKSVKRVFSYYSSNYEALFSEIEWIEATLNDIPSLEIAFKNVPYLLNSQKSEIIFRLCPCWSGLRVFSQ